MTLTPHVTLQALLSAALASCALSAPTAPVSPYGPAAPTYVPAPVPYADEVPVYAEAEEELGGYENKLDSAASDAEGADPLKMLMNAVPGVPGEDYPIYAETPETAFSCEGQVDGGENVLYCL